MTALADLCEHLPRLASVFAGCHVLHRVDTIEKMVGGASAFLGAWFGRADIELAVHCDRVAVDDLAGELFGERERQRSLSTGCGAENHDEQRLRRSDF